MSLLTKRIIEAYIGEYASGKSEVSVNRAISLVGTDSVTLVDLDLVEPFYTLRPIKKRLIKLGVDVVAWETTETMGLGEAGSLIKPEMRWVLRRPGHIILDIGYGVEGAKILNLIEGASESEDLKVIVVINTGRPMTSTSADIVEYIKSLGPVNGIVNNTHLGDETTLEFVQNGARTVSIAASELGIPVIATYLERKFEQELKDKKDCMGNPIKFLDRYMADTYW